MKIVAVIPAYNEGGRIANSVRDAAQFVSAVVVIDDCSADKTGAQAGEAGAYVLTHLVNRGQGAALQTGTDFALHNLGADVIVHFDADGQMQGKDIPAMVEPIVRGDVAITLGSRYLGSAENIPATRRIIHKGAIVFTYILSGLRMTDPHCGFRALSAHAARSIRITMNRMAHASEIPDQIVVKKLSYREVPVHIRYSAETLAKGQKNSAMFRVAYDFLRGKFIK